jgi:hypothetical protein
MKEMKKEHPQMGNLMGNLFVQTAGATVCFVVLTSLFRLALDAATGAHRSPTGWLASIVVGAVVFAVIYYVPRRRRGAMNDA